MGTQGRFGYILSGKMYLMHVQYDAYVLWEFLLNDLYILLKHFTIEQLKEKFQQIKIVDKTPTPEAIEQCKYFTNLDVSYKRTSDWYCLLYECQKSFIYLLEAGYIINTDHKYGYVIVFDFDKNILVDLTEYDQPPQRPTVMSIENIFNCTNPPTQTYTEIIENLHNSFEIYCQLKDKLISFHKLFLENKKLSENLLCQMQEIYTFDKYTKILYGNDTTYKDKDKHPPIYIYDSAIKSIAFVDSSICNKIQDLHYNYQNQIHKYQWEPLTKSEC